MEFLYYSLLVMMGIVTVMWLFVVGWLCWWRLYRQKRRDDEKV